MDYGPLHQAVSRLAGVCDFAETRDDQGFNGADAYYGHALADMGVAAWTDEMALTAWDMLRTYRHTQLKEWGIDYDELPVPPGGEELVEERRAEAREATRSRVREHRAAKARKAGSFVLCDGVGEEVVLKFVAGDEFWTMVAESKAITGREYRASHHGFAKVNTYPFISLPAVVQFADKWEIDVTPEVRALAAIALDKHADAVAAAEKAAAEAAARPHVRLGERGGLILDKARDSDTTRLNAALKALNGGRSTWDWDAGVHRPPYRRSPEGLKKLIADFGLTISPEAQQLIDDEIALQELNLAESVVAVAEPLGPVPGLAEDVVIAPQQWPTIRFAVRLKRTFIGDDMGLGKSLAALAATAINNAYPAVIVCLPNLTLNWKKELERFPHVKVFIAEGQKAQPIPYETDVVIIGTSILSYSPKGSKEFPWVKAISALQPKAFILDEGQVAKEWTSNRTKAIAALAEPIVERDGMVLDLSGTLMMNRPKELAPQLEITGNMEHFGGTGSFLMRHCVSESNQYGRKFDGAHNLIELHHDLRRFGCMIRRTKAILNLPPCHEPIDRIPVGQLDPKFMKEYFAAEANVVKFLADKAEQLAKRFGVDPTSARVRAAMKAQAAEHLVLINTLRQLIGQAKLPVAEKMVADWVAQGEKVVVAAHHKEVTGALAKRFGGLKIVGDQTAKAKETDKHVFQTNPNAMVITVAVEAGGTGHTLTAARMGVLVEQVWTPGGRNQMRDRFNRMGQKREMWFHTLIAEGTVDEYMHEVVTTKQARLDAVLDGKADEGVQDDEKSVVAEVAWKLALQGFGGRA